MFLKGPLSNRHAWKSTKSTLPHIHIWCTTTKVNRNPLPVGHLNHLQGSTTFIWCFACLLHKHAIQPEFQSDYKISSLWVVFNSAVAKTRSRGRCVDSQAPPVRESRQAQETMMKCSISVVINSFSRSSSSRSVPFPPHAGWEGSLWSVWERFLWHTVHLRVCELANQQVSFTNMLLRSLVSVSTLQTFPLRLSKQYWNFDEIVPNLALTWCLHAIEGKCIKNSYLDLLHIAWKCNEINFTWDWR